MDLSIAPELRSKMRRDWGLQNIVQAPSSLALSGDIVSLQNQNASRVAAVKQKIHQFCETAIYPQQLTLPRQYATTREGCWVHSILEGRTISGFKENGVRVVVQENAQQARFIISPLFTSKNDALSWAVKHMGAQT